MIVDVERFAGDEAPDGTTSPTVAAEVTSPPSSVAPTTVSSTTTTTTTTVPSVPEGAGLDELAELIETWAAASSDASISPLGLAVDLIGFPLGVPMPEGATVEEVELRATPITDGAWAWEWAYAAVAGPDPGEVDLDAEDRGPGAVALRATFDPIMTRLGFAYSLSTVADLGEPGGPGSVSHLYGADGGTILVGGVARTAGPVAVSLFDDLVGIDDGVETAGFRVEVAVETPTSEVPVRLVDEIVTATPRPEGANLNSVVVRSTTGADDAATGEADRRLLAISLDWDVPAAAGQAFAATVVESFPDPDRLRAATVSFVDPTTFEPARVAETSGGWRIDVLVADRYAGMLMFETDDDGSASLALNLLIEPDRPELTPGG